MVVSTSLDIKALVVDDNRSMLGLVRGAMRALGVRTVKAFGQVDHALDYCRRESPNLVVTDWEMEPIDGLEFVKRLRQNPDPAIKRIPIIMITAHASLDRVVKARDAGVNEFLVKPFSTNELASKILSVIDRPRLFIRTPEYSGPDRRRNKLPYADEDRRKPIEGVFFGSEGLSVDWTGKTIAPTLPEGDGNKLSPYSELAERFDVELPQTVTRIQRELDAASSGTKSIQLHLGRIFKAAHDLKGQGSVFGYNLITKTANSLCRFIETTKSHTNTDRIAIVRAHVEMLNVVATYRIMGEGGQTGVEIIGWLENMVNNYGRRTTS